MGSVTLVTTAGGTATITKTSSWSDTSGSDETWNLLKEYGSYAFTATPANGWRFSHWERRTRSYSDNHTTDSLGEYDDESWTVDNSWGNWTNFETHASFTTEGYLLKSNTDYISGRYSGTYYHSEYWAEFRAVFVQEETLYNVTTAASPSGAGTTTGDGRYAMTASCTVTATPANGYTFVKWVLSTGDESKTASYTFIVPGDVTATAHFRQNNGLPLHGAGGTLLFGSSGGLLFDG